MITLETTNLLRSLESIALLEVMDELRFGPLSSDPLVGPALAAVKSELVMRGQLGKFQRFRASHPRIIATKTEARSDSRGGV